jgi:hypothetical protein
MVRGVRLWIAFFFTVWLVCSSPSAWAATYHVSMTGDDTLPGTELQPWRTLAKANAAAQPGDIITVGAGTWSETPTTARHGTAEKPIVWRGNGDTSIISSFVIRHDYIQLRNFQVTGTVTLGGQNSNVNGGKQTGLVANYILVENCLFTRTDASKISVGGNPPFYTGPVGTIIRKNRFINNAAKAPALGFGASEGLIEDNYFTSNLGGDAITVFGQRNIFRGNTFDKWSRPEGSTQHTDLFQSFTNNGEISKDHVIEGNFAYNCLGTQLGNITDLGQNSGISNWSWRNNIFIGVSNPLNLYCPDFLFANNTFFRSPRYAGSCVVIKASIDRGIAHNTRFFNNLFYKSGSSPDRTSQGWYSFDQGDLKLTGFEADNNLVIGEGAGTIKSSAWTWFATNKNSFNGIEPLFVNAASPTKPEDLRLQPNSPVIGKGRNLSEFFTTDFSGRKRGTTWDIGAFQSGKGLGAPTGFRTQ